MDLVTITCEQDFDIMQLQSESINKFLEPCTHWVIVNERFPNKKRWRAMLEPFYINHKLILIFPKWYEYLWCIDGYARHQVYKLKMVKYITAPEFLCLDPKDFFVRPCSTTDWTNVLGCGRLHYSPNWDPAIERFAKRLGMLPIKEQQFASECPFVWRTDLLRSLGDIEKFCNWYLKGKCGELVLYSYLANHLVNETKFVPRTFGKIFWRHDPPITRSSIDCIYNDLQHKVMGFHRYVRYRASEQELIEINKWLAELGFKTPIRRFNASWGEKLTNWRYYKHLSKFVKDRDKISRPNAV